MMVETKLLMIDDEASFLATLEKRLSVRGMTVLCATGGAEGLTLLDANPDTDVVLLDVKMPEMGGILVLRRIKAAHPLVEVIMLTGHGTVEDAIEGMRLGAFDFLMKPCPIDDLVAKVQDARGKKHHHLAKILEAEGKRLRGRIAR